MRDAATRSLPLIATTEWLKPLPVAMRFSLNGDFGTRAAAAAIWGSTFAEEPCRAAVQGTRATLWLGPDEYLLLGADAESEPAVEDALQRALTGMPHSLVNIGHRQFALELSGPHAAAILSGACPLDLHLDEFPTGMCTRTVLAKADIVLWRIRDDAFHLEVWRSFAGYVTGLLSEIAAEFYGRSS
jgi:sarcosine oxidase subunit gamma